MTPGVWLVALLIYTGLLVVVIAALVGASRGSIPLLLLLGMLLAAGAYPLIKWVGARMSSPAMADAIGQMLLVPIALFPLYVHSVMRRQSGPRKSAILLGYWAVSGLAASDQLRRLSLQGHLLAPVLVPLCALVLVASTVVLVWSLRRGDSREDPAPACR